MLPALDAAHRHARERRGDHLVHEIRIAAAEVVREIADNGFLSGTFLDLVAQILADVGLFLVTVGIRLARLAQVIALPLRAF